MNEALKKFEEIGFYNMECVRISMERGIGNEKNIKEDG